MGEERSRWQMAAMAIMTFGMSIYSFYTTYQSYMLLNRNTNNFNELIMNWKAAPLVDVKLLAPGSSCPVGYELGKAKYDDNTASTLETIGQFPGSKTWCECHPNGFKWTFTYRKIERCNCPSSCSDSVKRSNGGTCPSSTSTGESGCTSTQRSAGCKNVYSISTFDKTETWNTQAGSCPTNATKAGCKSDTGLSAKTLPTFSGKVVCYKRAASTSSVVERPKLSGTACPSGSKTCGSGGYSGGQVCVPAGSECPVTFLSGGFNGTSAFNITTTESTYRPIIEVRVTPGPVCQYETGKEGFVGRLNNPRISNKYDQGCSDSTGNYPVDGRYKVWAEVAESTFYDENSVGSNGGQSLSGRTVANGPLVSYTTPAVRYDSYSQYKWRLSYRHEFFWKEDCAAGDQSAMAERLEPLKTVRGYQLMLCVLNGLFGMTILGIVFPYIYTMKFLYGDEWDLSCIASEGEEELKTLDTYQTWLGHLARVAKFGPLAACILVTMGIKGFFVQVKAASCSDSETNGTLDFLGVQITALYDNNLQTLGIDCAMLAVAVLMAGYNAMFAEDNPRENFDNEL